MKDNFKIDINIPESVENAVQNLTDKPTALIGTTFENILFLAFGNINQAATKRKMRFAKELNDYSEDLCNKVKAIPIEQLVEPNLRVVALALEAVKYVVEDKTIREIFTNLIISSLDSKTTNITHPSFIEIVKQLDSIDAQILSFLNKNLRTIPLLQFREVEKSITLTQINDSFFEGFEAGFGKNFLNHYAIFDNTVNITDLWQISVSFENLKRLGLIELHYDYCLNDLCYESFISDLYCQFIKNYKSDKFVIKAQKGICTTTELGLNFMKVCL